MPRNQFVAAGVVQATLDSAVHPADSEAFGFVEVWDRLIVLSLPVLHHELRRLPVAIDRKANAAAGLTRISEEPIEAVLSRTELT